MSSDDEESGNENNIITNNANNDENKKDLTPTEAAIIELMKRQNLQLTSTSNEGKKHAFWDTQVSELEGDYLFCIISTVSLN
jgi:hypothetical protein